MLADLVNFGAFKGTLPSPEVQTSPRDGTSVGRLRGITSYRTFGISIHISEYKLHSHPRGVSLQPNLPAPRTRLDKRRQASFCRGHSRDPSKCSEHRTPWWYCAPRQRFNVLGVTASTRSHLKSPLVIHEASAPIHGKEAVRLSTPVGGT